MVCPKCLHEKTQIYNSRATTRNNQTWRRRRCMHCHFEFSTREYIETGDFLQVVTPLTTKPFSRVKLLLSVAKACEHQNNPDVAFYLLGVIENKLLHLSQKGIISSKDILATTLAALHAFDIQAFLAYLAIHPQVQDNRDLKRLLKSLG